MKRCNLGETDEGIKLCRGNHEKHDPCEWEYFVPAEAVATQREACAKICDDEAQSWFASYAEGSESRGYEVEALKRAAQRMRSNVEVRGCPPHEQEQKR